MKPGITLMGALTAILALGACSQGENGEQTASSEASAEDVRLQPGKYEMTVEVVDLQLPEMAQLPGGNAEDVMRSQMETTTTYCLTPEDAESSAFARTGEEARKQAGGNCTVERDENTNTKLDMVMSCTPQGGTMKMTLTGNMTASGTEVNMKADGDMGGEKMSFETRHVTRRVGDCDDTEAGTGPASETT